AAPAVPLACTGPVSYTGHERLARDLELLLSAVGDAGPDQVFACAVAPSGVGGNEYYPTEAAYLDAVADALHEEYAAAACAASRRSGCGCTPATASTRGPACTTLRWPSTWTRCSRSGPGRSPSRPPTRGTSTCTTCSSRSSRRGTRCCCPGSSATPPTSWSTPTPSRTGSSGSPSSSAGRT